MGRRKNNPKLVDELINGRLNMPQEEFEEKYASLSFDDMCKVSDVIDNMQNEWLDDIDDEYENDDSERLSVYDAAMIWLSHGKDEDYMFGYSEDELEDAL